MQRFVWAIETPLDWPRRLPVIVTFYEPLHPGFHAKGINWSSLINSESLAWQSF
ncbi:hypothetical protein [Paraburkholderia youngii]|uniref:hypothetical protein n=1 Tax=Paraburkholderia youngii TaxID=2782701 RepID=UPI003D262EE5